MPIDLGLAIETLRRGLNDWAPAIQAAAALATLWIAWIATGIARRAQSAEEAQAAAAQAALDAANRQLEAAASADRARQREAQILAIHPLLLKEPVVRYSGGQAHGYVSVNVPPTSPALGVKLIGRQDVTPDFSAVEELGALEPDSGVRASLNLTPFVDQAASTEDTLDDYGQYTGGDVLTREGPIDLILEWEGSLGQRVIEQYTWYLHKSQVPVGGRQWRLCRLQVVTSVEGAAGFDRTFC